ALTNASLLGDEDALRADGDPLARPYASAGGAGGLAVALTPAAGAFADVGGEPGVDAGLRRFLKQHDDGAGAQDIGQEAGAALLAGRSPALVVVAEVHRLDAVRARCEVDGLGRVDE